MRNLLLAVPLCLLPVFTYAQATKSGKSAPASKAHATEIYTTTCQICHGANGTGSPLVPGSAFAGRTWKHGTRQQDIVNTITNGVPGTAMLPFKDRLSPAEIAAVAALVRSYDKTLKPAPAVKKQ